MPEENINDQHVIKYTSLISPYLLHRNLPRSDLAESTVINGRQGIERILEGKDPRKFIIFGPCSIDNPESAREYAYMAKELSDDVSDQFLSIVRTYFEKPRTGLGWDGLIIDPNLDASNEVIKGLHVSREVLLDIAEIGLATGTEYLESFTPQYNSDLISWAAIGARTASSPQHRKLASGLSMPAGIKNDTHGDVGVAVNAVRFSRESQTFLGIDYYGVPAVVTTLGNPYVHIILRGGEKGPNYDQESVKEAQAMLESKGLAPNVVIDCSHGNSEKDYEKQLIVFDDVIKQIRDGNSGIVGIMLESNIHEGNQSIPTDLTGFDKSVLRHGVSVTDGCIGFDTTKKIIMEAYKSLRYKP